MFVPKIYETKSLWSLPHEHGRIRRTEQAAGVHHQLSTTIPRTARGQLEPLYRCFGTLAACLRRQRGPTRSSSCAQAKAALLHDRFSGSFRSVSRTALRMQRHKMRRMRTLRTLKQLIGCTGASGSQEGAPTCLSGQCDNRMANDFGEHTSSSVRARTMAVRYQSFVILKPRSHLMHVTQIHVNMRA